MNKISFLLLSLIITLSGCEDSSNTPDASLSEYLKERTSKDVDLEFYQKYTGGKLLSAIEALSEEEFKEAGKRIDVKKKNFKILKKNCNNKEVCFLTYVLEYDSPSEKPETISEVKKIAELHKIENQWKIVDVTNVKTYHENKEPLVINLSDTKEASQDNPSIEELEAEADSNGEELVEEETEDVADDASEEPMEESSEE